MQISAILCFATCDWFCPMMSHIRGSTEDKEAYMYWKHFKQINKDTMKIKLKFYTIKCSIFVIYYNLVIIIQFLHFLIKTDRKYL